MCATGRFRQDWINTDGPTLFGWFNSTTGADLTSNMFPENFLGCNIEKSDGRGIACRSAYRTIGDNQTDDYYKAHRTSPYTSAPYLFPGQGWVDFYLAYDPSANSGNGAITVKIGTKAAQTFNLDTETPMRAKDRGFALDRFGLLTKRASGSHDGASFYFDKLTYTVVP
jgi:hypothetical protein